jgi:hypothetical protein
MVGFTVVEHVVWRSECVWASAVIAAMIWCTAYLIVLGKSLIGGSGRVFLAEVAQNSSPNSLVAHSRQNRCCVLAFDSCASYHCSEGASGLCLVSKSSFAT